MKTIIINSEGVEECHISGNPAGQGLTLCGLDVESDFIDHKIIELNSNKKSNCQQCYSFYKAMKALKIKDSDFTNEVKS